MDNKEVEQMDEVERHDLEQQEMNNLFKAVFNTEQGKKVLANLKHIGNYESSTFFGEESPNAVLYREGQRSMVLYILKRLQEEELK